jgi:XTP/dITP diphosphohydrolase
MKSIYFITSNKGKAMEAKNKLSSIGYKIVQENLGYPEVQADSLEEVANFGSDYLEKKIDKPFILEDAGLFIDVLSGFPGVYSSYVFHTIGCEGILELLKNKKNRKATFKSVFCYKEPSEKPILFIGDCKGIISNEKRGKNGFGYDPIFIPKKSKKTFAEMNVTEKNKFSHRGKSLDKLIDFFKKQ